jgi:drug/metabolite transporter (DMT)-like permease
VARGTAPAFLAMWSFIFLHEKLTFGGRVGLGMIIGGLIVIGLSTLLQSNVSRLHFKGIAIALTIALLISIYTTIDGAAVKRGEALPYVMVMFTLVPLPVTPLVLRQYGWQRIKKVWRQQRYKLPFMGLIGVIAYLMAVYSYSLAPLSYAGAIREVTVVFGAFAGWQFLGEKMGGMRVLGATIIFAGILVIALYG